MSEVRTVVLGIKRSPSTLVLQRRAGAAKTMVIRRGRPGLDGEVTLAAGDARYLQLNSGPDSGLVIVENISGGKELALWNQTRSIYQILRITGEQGSETITFTDLP